MQGATDTVKAAIRAAAPVIQKMPSPEGCGCAKRKRTMLSWAGVHADQAPAPARPVQQPSGVSIERVEI